MISACHNRQSAGDRGSTPRQRVSLEFITLSYLGAPQKNFCNFFLVIFFRLHFSHQVERGSQIHVTEISKTILINNQVYVTFPRAFWLGAKDQPDDKPPAGFTQWLHPSYAKLPARKEWNQEAVDLATLPDSYAHPTLLFYIYGDQGSMIANKWNDLGTQEKRTPWLAEYFKPYLEKLAHYNADSAACVPSYCLATSWTTDNLAGNGSYSNFPVGLKEGDKDIEVMREGVPEKNLWFAGEHTAPFVALGTVTGAYWSGEMVAQRIAEKYGKSIGSSDILKGDKIVRGTGDGKAINFRGFADDGAETG
jgi:hypothetical protein